MYQFSRAIYRELARYITADGPEQARQHHQRVLNACEATIERLAFDRDYFARPARTLFSDIRVYFPLTAQRQVRDIVARYLCAADAYLATLPRHGRDLNGEPLRCRATTRKGTACQREPLAHNGYCPSHQHLAETEELRSLPDLGLESLAA